ncbi:hypothetical protein ACFWY6_43435 [Streptomyces sp. NPDC059037]|uniref:hypothetical protein n=1 Tax=Streptomyces sp. NPDC059037 TaxID=3346710 RepID=UPI0036D1FBFA
MSDRYGDDPVVRLTEHRAPRRMPARRRVTKLSPATAESGGMVDGSVGGRHCRPMERELP